MRKDVECTFGILKGMWQILKAGVRIQCVVNMLCTPQLAVGHQWPER